MGHTDGTTNGEAADKRADRAARILDAAAELLVAWGYKRVSIEEVAKRAHVGKGTVYLHFRTKESLFLVVLLREQTRLGRMLLDAMVTDAETVRPGRLAALGLRFVSQDPVLSHLVSGDTGLLGTLVRTAKTDLTEIVDLRAHTTTEHFRLLREAGVVRDTLPLDEQVFAFAAVIGGFVLSGTTVMLARPASDALYRVTETTVRDAFETPEAGERVGDAAPAVRTLYRNLIDRVNEEIARLMLR